jgi:hypothetical protein
MLIPWNPATWLFLAAEGEMKMRRGTSPEIARSWATAITEGRATGRLGEGERPIVTPTGSDPNA